MRARRRGWKCDAASGAAQRAPAPRLTVKPKNLNPKAGASPRSKVEQLRLKCAQPHRKLSSPDSPDTKLKLLWRDTLTEAERDYWREQLTAARPLSALRRELLAKFNIELKQDYSLSRFRHWVDVEDLRLAEAELVAADEAELLAQGLQGEELRAALLERMKARALTRGDFKLGATAVRLDLLAEAMALNQEKFKESLRTKAQTGLAAILAEAKDDPVVAAAVKQIQEAIE